MKKLAYAASLLASLTLVACGGDDGDGTVTLPDASVPVDSGNGNSGVCDVLAGTGCEAGEKCSFIIDDNLQSFPSVCIPAGTVAAGGACTYTEVPGTPTQVQDLECEMGTQCIFGFCRTVVADEAFSCDDAGDETARVFGGVWEDQADARDIGFCFPQCDPLLQEECRNEAGADGNFGTEDDRVEGCFRKFYVVGQDIVDVDFACFGVDTVTNTQTAAGDPCVGPQAGQCFLNGVPRGTTLLFTGAGVASVVTPYCRFQPAHLETDGDQGNRDALANGDPTLIEGDRPGSCSATNFGTGDGANASWECSAFDEARFLPGAADGDIATAFNNLNDLFDLPPDVGICVDNNLQGPLSQGGDPEQIYPTVTAFDLQNVRDDVADGNFDGLIGAAEYELCVDCLDMDDWIAFAGTIARQTGKSAARAKALKQSIANERPVMTATDHIRNAISVK